MRVAIIGAGVAGLTIAYELGKRGYACTVLEARNRPGGRVQTIRRGTVSEEDGPTQTCAFDEGLYFNCGAMRIAHHHTTTLEYCRELNVPVEVFAAATDSQFLYQTRAAGLNGTRVRLREVRTDLDGYVAELLSKSISADALSKELSKDDAERLLEYLKNIGRLDAQLKYRGHEMRGPDQPAGSDGVARFTPLPLHELLGSRAGYYINPNFDYQPTMMQIAGGSDRLPQALAAQLKGRIVFQAAAREIRQNDKSVSVVYADRSGSLHKLEADYLVCALPLTILSTLDTDFTQRYKDAIASVPYSAAGKMGLQFKRRFWEEDDQIFGGSSRTDQDIQQIVYPSPDFSRRRASWSATTCRVRAQNRSGRRRRPSGRPSRSSRAPASILSTRRNSRTVFPWRGTAWPGARGPGP